MEYYPDDAISYGDVNSNLQCQLYAELGLKYSINEFRASWKLGGKPLVQRLIDKQHDWNDLRKLIPENDRGRLLRTLFYFAGHDWRGRKSQLLKGS